jgi:hypothetical protein
VTRVREDVDEDLDEEEVPELEEEEAPAPRKAKTKSRVQQKFKLTPALIDGMAVQPLGAASMLYLVTRGRPLMFDPEAVEELKKSARAYAKTLSFEMTPGQALAFTFSEAIGGAIAVAEVQRVRERQAAKAAAQGPGQPSGGGPDPAQSPPSSAIGPGGGEARPGQNGAAA